MMSKKQIPNILSFIRLLMVPLFAVIFFSNIPNNKLLALAVFILAGLTDILDGYLARRNNWITDLGKFLDPLADKLMQFTAFVCLAIKNSFLTFLVIIVVIKECLFLVGGMMIKKKANFVVASKWYGKLATFVITICVCTLILWWDVPIITYICAAASAFSLIFAFVMYLRYYYVNLFHAKKDNNQ